VQTGTVIGRSSHALRMKLATVNGCLGTGLGTDGLSVFFRRTSQVLAINVLMAVMGLASGLLAARLLGPERRGELAAIQSWPMLFAALAMLGMPEALVYFSSRERCRAADYLGTATIIALLAGVGFLTVGWILMPVLLCSQTLSTIWFARIYLLMIPLYAVIDLPRNVLRATSAWGTWNGLRLIHTSLWLTVLVGSCIAKRFTNPGMLVCLFLGLQVLFALPHSLVIARNVPGPYRCSASCRRQLLEYGIPTMLTILPQTLNLRLDQLLMASLLAPQPLGYYVVAVAWAGAAAPVFQSVGAVLFPYISAMHEPLHYHEFLKVHFPRVLLLVSSITILLLAVTPVAIRLLFGPEFSPSIPAALILTTASGFSGLNLILSASLQGLGRPKSILKAEFLGLAVTMVSLAILLPAFGIVGAAVSSFLAYSFTTCALIISTLRIRVQTGTH